MKHIWRSTICIFFLLVLLARAQNTGALPNPLLSCHPTCNSCAVLNTSAACMTCNGDAFMLSPSPSVCFCQGAAASNTTTCTPQNTYLGGSVVYSLMGNFSQAIANEWNYTAPIAYCNAGQALLNLSAQNPNVSYAFPGMTVPTHQVAVVTLKIELFLPVQNSSINVTLSSDGFNMTKQYNSSTTGLVSGACSINGTAFLEDTVSFSFQDTSTTPNFSVSVQADNASWVGIRNFQFQAANCSANCAGSCSGPGPNQCLQCPIGSIGPVNGLCTCLDGSTVSPNGTCANVSSIICPFGCNRCSNFGSGVSQCYECLPGYSLLQVEDGINQLSSICIANNALSTNNHALAGPACDSSCRQCYGTSKYQCSSCWENSTLTRVGDVGQCVQVTGVSADNLTADQVVASTNLSICQVSWTSHHICTAITEQYLSNLQAGHWLSTLGTTQVIYVETQAPQTVCETCMIVQLVYVYPNQTTVSLNYTVNSTDIGLGMQNIAYSASFTPENISAWNCLLSSDNATMTWYTCSFQLIFATMDGSVASYDFNISSYINYFVNDSINIIDLIGETPGTASNDTELCADPNCTVTRNNSAYTNNDSATIQVCIPDQTGNNLTLTKSNITAVIANPNGTFRSVDMTNQVTEEQIVNCVTYTIPLINLPVGNITFLIQSRIISWPLGTRRFLQEIPTGSPAVPALNSVQHNTVNIEIQYPEIRDYTPVTYNNNQNSQVPKDTSDQGNTWWIIGASILGGAILVTLLLIIYMGLKERGRTRTVRSSSRKLSDMQPTTGNRVLSGIPQQPSNPDIQPKRSGSVEQPTTVIVPEVPVLPTYVPQEPKSAAIPKGVKKMPSGGFIV